MCTWSTGSVVAILLLSNRMIRTSTLAKISFNVKLNIHSSLRLNSVYNINYGHLTRSEGPTNVLHFLVHLLYSNLVDENLQLWYNIYYM